MPDPDPLSTPFTRSIPGALTGLRAFLAPVLLVIAHFGASRLQFGICLTVAFLSDIFDGVLARRFRIATPGLRRLDSAADTIFYLAALYSAWYLYPEAVISRTAPLIALVVLEVSRYAFDWLKFRREASYHMWSSKAWGIALFVAFFSLLAYGSNNATMTIAVYLGIAADLEGLAISAVLREWQSDVPTLLHALTLRQRALKGHLQGVSNRALSDPNLPVTHVRFRNARIDRCDDASDPHPIRVHGQRALQSRNRHLVRIHAETIPSRSHLLPP